MGWLSAHFWLLFSGVGGPLLVALFIYFLQRRERSAPTGGTTVRDSQLTGSPIASGSQITQHNYFNPTPATVSPAAPTTTVPTDPTGEAKPHSNIQMTGTSVVTVSERDWVWKDDGSGDQAVVIQFANEAKTGVRIGGVPVKALLIYKNDGAEVLRIIGSWLYELREYTELRIDEPHKLMVGVRYGQRFVAIERRHAFTPLKPHPHDLPEFQTVSVRLTNANNGDVLYEGAFRVTIDPLKIVPLD